MTASSAAIAPTASEEVMPEARGPAIAEALAAELRAGGWSYPFALAPGVSAAVGDPGARHAASTLERMLEEPARDALALAGTDAAALDLACGEGRLAHRLLGWHARRVVGVETRPGPLRRAELLRHHYAIRASELELRGVDDLDGLDRAALGQFDVVILAGMVDRVGDTGALIRLARALTRGLCAIETGRAGSAGLAETLREAGFGDVRRVAPPFDAERRYALGERGVLLARPGGAT